MTPRKTRLALTLVAVGALGVAGFLGASLVRIALFGAPVAQAAPRAANVLVITVDSGRRDHTSIYGYRRDTTPRLAAMAADGFVFTEAFTASTYSGPSHATLFTGLYPGQHGLIDNGLRLADGVLPMAGLLQGLGYRTAAFIGEEVIGPETDLDRGFDTYELHEVAGHEHDEKSLERDVAGYRAAREWLEAWHGDGEKEPFFLWLHVQNVHQSYDPPPPYDSLFVDVPRDVEVDGIDDFELRCATDVRKALERGQLSEPMKAQVVALYDGEWRLVDDEIGKLLAFLRRTGSYDRTLVVLTADHGEYLFEESEVDFGPGRFRHGRIYFEPVLRVPLVVKPPAGALARSGLRTSVTASTVDVLPTVMDLLGLEPPPSLPGRSLVPWMEDPERDDPVDTVYFHEVFRKRVYAGLRTPDYKFVRKVKGDETERWLLDLRNDPDERRNHYDDKRPVADDLERRLDEWLARQGTVTPGSLEDMSERMREALRKAGYLREDSDPPE